MTTKSSLLIPHTSREIPSQKFLLYLKVKEIKALNRALETVLSQSVLQQREWAESYGVIFDEALNSFIEDSNVILEKVSMEDEVLTLSEELVTHLKQAVQHIDFLLSEQQELES